MNDRRSRVLTGLFAAVAFAATGPIATAQSNAPTVTALPGKPVLLLGAFDLAPLGYQVEEYVLSGTAQSFRLKGDAGKDGRWDAVAADSAAYTTRIVVVRPSDPAKFNGTVLTEWLNVTSGSDTPADWMVTHREILRRGYAWVAVSAQKAGVDGGGAIMNAGGRPIKQVNPARYGALVHPGDAWSFDIFSQAGALLKRSDGNGVLGSLVPRHIVAIGESQSAAFLTTYINAVDPLARIYDGFLVHSRFGSAAAIDGTRMAAGSQIPQEVRFRTNLRVPVLTAITETDLLGARLPGYYGARQPQAKRLRVWEIAGTAHADAYMFGGAFIDSGKADIAQLARAFQPSVNTPVGKLDKPANPGTPHHYVMQGAVSAIDRWVRTGAAPANTTPLAVASAGTAGTRPSLVLDGHGIALGGVRTPWTDVPTVRLSGVPVSESFIGMLVGSGVPLDKATLVKLYPGGKADYLRRFTRSLDAAIARGHLLAEDRQEILEIAAINFDALMQ